PPPQSARSNGRCSKWRSTTARRWRRCAARLNVCARGDAPDFSMSQTTQVNIALIGAGAVAATHLNGFREHPAARVVAIAEPAEERGREMAARFGVPEWVPDYRTLLEREDIQVFSVALPNHLHAPVTLAALQAGK